MSVPARRWVLAVALGSALSGARAGEALRNWFDDPFFAVSAAAAHCPLPAGPFVSERERRQQAHHRAEKGTTCWLAGECERPNAYAYDRDIAAAIRQALAGQPALAGSSLWVTVQGRVVFFEGCAPSDAAVASLERTLRAVPYVQQVVPIVRVGAQRAVPYRINPAP